MLTSLNLTHFEWGSFFVWIRMYLLYLDRSKPQSI